MNILSELNCRFRDSLALLVDDPDEFVEMVRPSQNPRFGDYQANCAMPLGKRLARPPRDVAQQIIEKLDVTDMCEPPVIAGPGFINLRIRDQWLTAQLTAALKDPQRLGVEKAKKSRTYVIDYSAPNVAKPMHVGHIRSTAIGESLYRTLNFLGHRVISDNHIGDWGTQFGMIIYGYRHFLDAAAFKQNAVDELGRLYKLVNRLVDYHDTKNQGLPELEKRVVEQQAELQQLSSSPPSGDKAADKKTAKVLRRLKNSVIETQKKLKELKSQINATENDNTLMTLAEAHSDIGGAVLDETAKLHSGDKENLKLWQEFLPPCREEIEATYRRLGVTFDHTLGESFYQDRLANVVADLKAQGLASQSEGAVCIFLEGFDTPMLIQKKDGAFLYATTDLATIQYRIDQFKPDAILYVVDHRQSLHFAQLFATARRWGHENVELEHIAFGTVMGEDGRPFRARSGETVGLSGLLDKAVNRAYAIVCQNDDAKQDGAELSLQERKHIAEVVGIAALKYADLSHNRTSDYVFSYDKMLALNGNTATYMQYAYARVRNIFAKGKIDMDQLRDSSATIRLNHPAERALGLELLKLSEVLEMTVTEYFPNHLTNYLYELAGFYTTFYTQCPVLKADAEATRHSRLLLCDLTARTLKQGLALLGIDVVEKM